MFHRSFLMLTTLTCLGMPALAIAQQNNGIEAVSCLVDPGRSATMSSQVPGMLDDIRVDSGDRVDEGETLFTLQREVEQASLELERARQRYAQRTLQRNQRLIEKGMLSESERDEIDTDVVVARLQANLAEARLGEQTGEAPFDGVIASLESEEGEFIDNTPILEIVQLDPLRIDLVMPLEAFGQYATGDTLDIRLQAPVDETVTAAIERIDSVIDPSSGTFGIRLRLDNPDGRYPAGINCRIAD
ncbi:efflux RND transporter periplasmic adaptor subunit [Aidingimonas lacisalsi]|uniref:efflux RND transporter periplasmic adaptor subunit n=1 Tax=Aidingimonas lacisalsi TaxID=2604086 RepID=UPI0011D2C071|nr:efflux RND transporter periplasmic adaptor subunit [Aidingimonas lacisalsi]